MVREALKDQPPLAFPHRTVKNRSDEVILDALRVPVTRKFVWHLPALAMDNYSSISTFYYCKIDKVLCGSVMVRRRL